MTTAEKIKQAALDLQFKGAHKGHIQSIFYGLVKKYRPDLSDKDQCLLEVFFQDEFCKPVNK